MIKLIIMTTAAIITGIHKTTKYTRAYQYIKKCCPQSPEFSCKEKTNKKPNYKIFHAYYSYFKCFSKYLISSLINFSAQSILKSIYFSSLFCSLSKSSLRRFSISESVIKYYPHGKYCLKQAPITHKEQAPNTQSTKFNLIFIPTSLYSLAKALNFKSNLSYNDFSSVSTFASILFTSSFIATARLFISSLVAMFWTIVDRVSFRTFNCARGCSAGIPEAIRLSYCSNISNFLAAIISAPLKLLDWVNYQTNNQKQCTNKCIDKNFQQHYSHSFLRHQSIVPIPNTICKFISIFSLNCVYNQQIGAAHA